MAAQPASSIPVDDVKRVAQIFPELGEISSDTLRAQVAAVWCKTWELSGYTDLHEAVFMPHLPTYSLVAHTRSVTRSAIGIATSLEAVHGIAVNRDRLVATALLHDAAKCVEYQRKADGTFGRSEVGRNFPHSYLVCEIGRQIGIPDEIIHLVAAHSPTSPIISRYIEGVILQHADLVDSDCMHFAEGVLTERVKRGLPSTAYKDIFEP